MEMSPDQLANATFRVVRRGFDPDEVQAFQIDAARALDAAQQYASLMEQRARAAISRASQPDQSGTGSTVTHGVDHTPAGQALTSSTVVVRADDAETSGRALVLAQRTADQTVAEAHQQAAAIRAEAEAAALRMRSDVELESARLLADARAEARRAGDAERAKVMGEVNALLARLDFLRDDVHALEAYATDQRKRLADAADAMRTLAESELGRAAVSHSPALSAASEHLRGCLRTQVLSPVATSAPVVAQDPVKFATSGASIPAAQVPVQMTYSEEPAAGMSVRPSSGPVVVPDIDDWDEDPSVRIRVVQPGSPRNSD
ncbi:MAG: DivIVA domain-containing protein [Ilumatobacteraceae bacterium]